MTKQSHRLTALFHMDHSFRFPEFVSLLEDAFERPLPGQVAQFRMAPIDRRDHEGARIENKPCREAAVLALFYPDPEEVSAEARLLLTVRPMGMNQHAGQIAFPGGRREQDEELVETALRETEEEVHVQRHRIRVLGTLTPLYVPPSNFCVHPFVGVMDEAPDLGVTSEEVDHAFGVPAIDLVRPEMRKETRRTIRGKERDIPYFAFESRFVWGATAMMLSELADLLQSTLGSMDAD